MITNTTTTNTYTDIQAAIDATNPGDVLEGEGTHYEQFSFTGKSDITLKAASGAEFKVSGAISSTIGWVYAGDDFDNNHTFWYMTPSTINGMQLVNEMYAYYTDEFDQQQRLWIYPTNAEWIDHLTGVGVYPNIDGDQLLVRIPFGVDRDTLRISQAEYICQLSNSQNITLQGIDFDCASTAVLFKGDCDNNLVTRSRFTNFHTGVWFKGTSADSMNSNVISYNSFVNLWRDNEWGWKQVKKPGVPDRIANMQGFAINVGCKGSGNIIEKNLIDTTFDGVRVGPTSDLGGDLDGTIVRRNLIQNCQDDAVNLEYKHTNTRVYRNILLNNFKSISGVPHIDGPSYIFLNFILTGGQILYDVETGEMWDKTNTKLYAHSSGPCQNLYFYNNTWIGDKYAFETSPPVLNLVVRNNLFRITGNGTSPRVVSGVGSVADGVDFDGNAYDRPSDVTGPLVTDWNGTGNHNSLAEAIAASAVFEANGFEADTELDTTERNVPGTSPVVGAAIALDPSWPWDVELGDQPLDTGWFQQGQPLPLTIDEVGPEGDTATEPDPGTGGGGSSGGCQCVCIPVTRRVSKSVTAPISEVVTVNVRV